LELAQVKMWLSQGDLQAATRWSASLQRFDLDDPFMFENELTHIAQARVLIAQNRANEAIEILQLLEETAGSAQRIGRVVEVLLLEALAMRQKGDSGAAILALSKCLMLAEPEGYMRVFLDQGESIQALLAEWLVPTNLGRLRDYAVRLLSQVETELPLITALQEKACLAGNQIEPLSQRELEVLQLMALGKTNKQIAQQLIVAPGTIKAHTASIYRKLDAGNRTEAVARARQLNILP
jgi:LuxR family maltose regulon positive regulatory protein